MKAKFGFILIALAFAACNSHEKEQLDKIKAMRAQDSVMAVQAKDKDSLITSYVNTMGDIQNNLDSLKQKEKILTMSSGEGNKNPKGAILDDIKSIDNAIIASNKEIAKLESRLHKMAGNDAKLKKLVDNLTREVAEKDSAIAVLQGQLGVANDTITAITGRYNTSVAQIRNQQSTISNMTTEMNTVYYAVGTMKQLKDKGAITKTGGILGIGKTSELSPQIKKTAFTQGDKTQISEIPLNGKLLRVVTSHPAGSYSINKTDKKHDTLVISDATSFWSESKYLVVEIK